MPPQSRRISKRDQKKLDQLKKYLISQGHDESAVEKAAEIVPSTADERMLAIEATLLHLARPGLFATKSCKRCGELFGTTYMYVGYCSDSCRAKDLEQMGIRWNPRIDRWQNLHAQPPMIVPPAMYKTLLEFAEKILEQRERIQIQSEPETQTLPDLPHSNGEVHQSESSQHTNLDVLPPLPVHHGALEFLREVESFHF